MKRVVVRMTPDQVKALRQIALDRNTSLQKLCAGALEALLKE